MKTLMKWSLEDYHNLINCGLLVNKNVEFLEGELIKMPPESPIHSYITENGSDYLRRRLDGLALVKEAHPITLINSEPEPDLVIAKLPRTQYKNRHPNAQDIFWLIEVSNQTLNYDLNDKKKIYARAGIKEYWVADLKNSQVHIFIDPENDDYKIKKIAADGIIKPQAFPDLQLSIDQLFLW
jgi:Uma2 family endonuclease